MMEAGDVLEMLALLRDHSIAAWLSGGWGVDALVGRQTRPHDDLDLVVPAGHAGAIERLMLDAHFVMAVDERPARFEMRDAWGRAVDVHPVTFDEHGNGIQRLQDGKAFTFPASGFTGRGLIATLPVPCLTAEVQLLCHAGYEPDAKDWQDMEILQQHFGIALPEPYRSAGGRSSVTPSERST